MSRSGAVRATPLAEALRHPGAPRMRCLPRSIAGLFLLFVFASTAAAAPLTLDREFRFAADRFKVVQKNGETTVSMKDATHEFTAGRPDLPVLGENIAIPAGMRVTGVEVRSADTEV